MKVANSLQIVDAREVYYRWNDQQYEAMASLLGDEYARYIKLIPLLLQINHKLLPGFTGPDTPVGIYGYKPDRSTLHDAQALINKFRYQKEGVNKHPAIDAIYFQKSVIDKSMCCWVFYRSGLSNVQVEELIAKTCKISQWFSAKGFRLSINCFSDHGIQDYIEKNDLYNTSIFLDFFYSEAILLAGKYPIWWLVPPDKEKDYSHFVDHIKRARFVDNEEFIDLGSVFELKPADFVKYAVEKVRLAKNTPETCLVELMIMDCRISAYPAVEGLSIRLKQQLYLQTEDIQTVDIVVELMQKSLAFYHADSHVLKPKKMFSQLNGMPGNLNHKVIDLFLSHEYQQQMPRFGIEKTISFLSLFKAMAFEIRQVFSNILNSYDSVESINESDQALISVARNMQTFLSDKTDGIPVYNNKDKLDIVLDRILLRHEIISDIDECWSLVLTTQQGQEKVIEGFGSLLGLLAWCWLNRLVNHSTQVSIDCPVQQIRQTQARYMLEVLMQQLNPGLLFDIPPEAFENTVRPLQALLFINLNAIKNKDITVNSDSLSFDNQLENFILHCEVLVVSSWGDVHTKLYTGNLGILQCLCEWMCYTPLDSLARPQTIKMFGHGSGDSTYMAQRVDQIYREMLDFFYTSRQDTGRFIVRLGGEYYRICVESYVPIPHKIGRQKLLMEYLEESVNNFQVTALERFAYVEYPLREIFRANRENVFQVFFQLINRACHVWVVDERGTLWQHESDLYERESFTAHWLYTFRNLLNRLKSFKYDIEAVSPAELPTLEVNQVSINQLGGIEFYTSSVHAIGGVKNFLDIQVIIKTRNDIDQLSLVCDGRLFDYDKFKHNVLVECVQYLSGRMITEGRLPVYVTDVDAPLKLHGCLDREALQMSHLLKLKRQFERRINQLLNAE